MSEMRSREEITARLEQTLLDRQRHRDKWEDELAAEMDTEIEVLQWVLTPAPAEEERK